MNSVHQLYLGYLLQVNTNRENWFFYMQAHLLAEQNLSSGVADFPSDYRSISLIVVFLNTVECLILPKGSVSLFQIPSYSDWFSIINKLRL